MLCCGLCLSSTRINLSRPSREFQKYSNVLLLTLFDKRSEYILKPAFDIRALWWFYSNFRIVYFLRTFFVTIFCSNCQTMTWFIKYWSKPFICIQHETFKLPIFVVRGTLIKLWCSLLRGTSHFYLSKSSGLLEKFMWKTDIGCKREKRKGPKRISFFKTPFHFGVNL